MPAHLQAGEREMEDELLMGRMVWGVPLGAGAARLSVRRWNCDRALGAGFQRRSLARFEP